MNPQHRVPLRISHVLEQNIFNNAGIVDQNIDATKSTKRRFNDSFAVFDAVVVCYSCTMTRSNVLNDGVGCLQGVS